MLQRTISTDLAVMMAQEAMQAQVYIQLSIYLSHPKLHRTISTDLEVMMAQEAMQAHVYIYLAIFFLSIYQLSILYFPVYQYIYLSRYLGNQKCYKKN